MSSIIIIEVSNFDQYHWVIDHNCQEPEEKPIGLTNVPYYPQVRFIAKYKFQRVVEGKVEESQHGIGFITEAERAVAHERRPKILRLSLGLAQRVHHSNLKDLSELPGFEDDAQLIELANYLRPGGYCLPTAEEMRALFNYYVEHTGIYRNGSSPNNAIVFYPDLYMLPFFLFRGFQSIYEEYLEDLDQGVTKPTNNLRRVTAGESYPSADQVELVFGAEGVFRTDEEVRTSHPTVQQPFGCSTNPEVYGTIISDGALQRLGLLIRLFNNKGAMSKEQVAFQALMHAISAVKSYTGAAAQFSRVMEARASALSMKLASVHLASNHDTLVEEQSIVTAQKYLAYYPKLRSTIGHLLIGSPPGDPALSYMCEMLKYQQMTKYMIVHWFCFRAPLTCAHFHPKYRKEIISFRQRHNRLVQSDGHHWPLHKIFGSDASTDLPRGHVLVGLAVMMYLLDNVEGSRESMKNLILTSIPDDSQIKLLNKRIDDRYLEENGISDEWVQAILNSGSLRREYSQMNIEEFRREIESADFFTSTDDDDSILAFAREMRQLANERRGARQ